MDKWMTLGVPWRDPVALASDQAQVIAVAMQQSLNFLIYIGISAQFRKAVMAVIRRQDLAAEGPTAVARNKWVMGAGDSPGVVGRAQVNNFVGVAGRSQVTKDILVTAAVSK